MFNYALTMPVGDILLKVVIEGLAAGFIAVAFAMLFSVPKRYLPYVYLGGAITKALRTLLFTGFNMDVAIATFIACCVSSLLFVYVAPKLGPPRPVFTVSSIIPLVPGMDAYTALLAMYKVIETGQQEISLYSYLIIEHGMRCIAILLAICLGIAVPPLFFYRYRHGGM